MQAINTTYSLSNSFGTASPTDTVVYVPLKSYTPIVPLNKPRDTAAWLGYTIVFLILLVFIRIRGKEFFSSLFQVIYKRKKYENILKEGITQNIVYYTLALLLSFSILSIGLIFISGQEPNLKRIVSVSAALLTYHILVLILLKIVSWTFNAKIAGEETRINFWSFNITAGFFIAPWVIALFFVKAFAINTLLKIIIICLASFYLVKIIRWLQILLAYRVSIFYMILYLCALEVLPLLIVYKILVY